MEKHKIWDSILHTFGMNRESSLLEKQQLAIFLCSELNILFISIASTILYAGLRGLFFYINNSLFILLPVVLFLFFYFKAITLKKALYLHILLYIVMACDKMIYAAVTSPATGMSDGIVLVDMTLLLFSYVVVYLSQVKNMNVLICVVALLSYTVATMLSKSSILLAMLPIFTIMFVLFAIYSQFMGRMVHKMEAENRELKQANEEISQQFEVSKKQLDALLSLAREDRMKKSEIAEVLELVGERAEKNIRKKVRYLIEQEQIDYSLLTERLPELARSEIEICDLILKGYKLPEMCRELGKTETNICSQRSHIRAKLGLSSRDNLKKVLEARMANGRETAGK